jgi:hypothetical protein
MDSWDDFSKNTKYRGTRQQVEEAIKVWMPELTLDKAQQQQLLFYMDFKVLDLHQDSVKEVLHHHKRLLPSPIVIFLYTTRGNTKEAGAHHFENLACVACCSEQQWCCSMMP